MGYILNEDGKDLLATVNDFYEQGITDEFMKPIVITQPDGNPLATFEYLARVIKINTERCILSIEAATIA